MTLEQLEERIAVSEKWAKEFGSESGLGMSILWPYNPKRRYGHSVRTPFGLCPIVSITASNMLLVSVSLEKMRKVRDQIKASL
jgi:hypothetical protein